MASNDPQASPSRSAPGLSPEEADEFAAQIKPSWELDDAPEKATEQPGASPKFDVIEPLRTVSVGEESGPGMEVSANPSPKPIVQGPRPGAKTLLLGPDARPPGAAPPTKLASTLVTAQVFAAPGAAGINREPESDPIKVEVPRAEAPRPVE